MEPSGIIPSNDGLKSKEEQPASEPLRRFETGPPKKEKPAMLAPMPCTTAPILIVQQPRLFTDQQMVAILIVFFVLVCFGIVVHAMRS